MPMPTLTDTGQRLYDALAPLAQHDQANNYAIAQFCAGLAVMFDGAATIVRDDSSGNPGWSGVFNVNTVDASWLPWLGQFVGVNLTGITSVAAQRSLIEKPTGFQRGDNAAITLAVQQTLTGTQTVKINNRAGNNPWAIVIATIASETPNPAATLAAIQAQVPAWLIVNNFTYSPNTYGQLAASHAQYTQMEAMHTSYLDVKNNPGA